MSTLESNIQTLEPIKRGDDLQLTYALPLAFANTIATVQAQVRTFGDDLIEELTVATLASTVDSGKWLLSATFTQTALWPLKDLYCDVKHVTTNGLRKHSATFIIPVIKEQTR